MQTSSSHLTLDDLRRRFSGNPARASSLTDAPRRTPFNSVLNAQLKEFLHLPAQSSMPSCFPGTRITILAPVLGLSTINASLFQKMFKSLIRRFRSHLETLFTDIPAELPRFVAHGISRHINWLISTLSQRVTEPSPRRPRLRPARQTASAPVSEVSSPVRPSSPATSEPTETNHDAIEALRASFAARFQPAEPSRPASPSLPVPSSSAPVSSAQEPVLDHHPLLIPVPSSSAPVSSAQEPVLDHHPLLTDETTSHLPETERASRVLQDLFTSFGSNLNEFQVNMANIDPLLDLCSVPRFWQTQHSNHPITVHHPNCTLVGPGCCTFQSCFAFYCRRFLSSVRNQRFHVHPDLTPFVVSEPERPRAPTPVVLPRQPISKHEIRVPGLHTQRTVTFNDIKHNLPAKPEIPTPYVMLLGRRASHLISYPVIESLDCLLFILPNQGKVVFQNIDFPPLGVYVKPTRTLIRQINEHYNHST
jgi:hypothetical protein